MIHSLLGKLGLRSAESGVAEATTELGRKLLRTLGDTDEATLRYLTAFGGLLGRVALADLHVSAEEARRIQDILVRFAHLSIPEAELVQAVIEEQGKALAGVEDHEYIREINALAGENKKLELLSCLFAVAAADDDISPEENQEIQTIASGLLLSHAQFISIRSLYRESLSFLKDLPK
jgi:uncharacterized tellurite resistance protein B-like protein